MRIVAVACIITILGAFPALAGSAAEIPNDKTTPGVVADDGHDQAAVCGFVDGLSYSKRHRATPLDLKAMLRKRDGCDPHNSEVDHRLPLALGGADEIGNLWCQPGPTDPEETRPHLGAAALPYSAPPIISGVAWNYHDKDRLEIGQWEALCKRHTMTLPEAQAMFLAPADWRVSYCLVFNDDPRCAKN